MDFKLTTPPADERSRELWLQHAAGFLIIENMRNYAINRIPIGYDGDLKEKITTGIDDAIYGLMMMMDGVAGVLINEEYAVAIESSIVLQRNGNVLQTINTFDGDGMCMGFHGWKEGDFGDDDIIKFNS